MTAFSQPRYFQRKQRSVVKTRNLSMHFGGVVALDNVSLDIKQNELRCLIGSNGAGKSTFFKCLCGMNRPTAGTVFLGGEETTHLLTHQISARGVGIKTQVPSVMDGLTVMENLWLAARYKYRGENIDGRCEQMLERLNLTTIAHRRLAELAHGQRQMVELGMVMIAEPWLILLDEPAAGLTSAEINRLTTVLQDIKQQATVIVVEHDMQFIRSIAETVTVFHRGKLLLESDVDTVMSDPQVREVYLGKNG